MVHVDLKGLAKAKALYEDRGLQARELAAQGKKVIGYLCSYTPVEIITALDMIPYRIQGGAGKPLQKADQYLETIMCPFVRSCFDMALSGEYDFISGVAIPHTCDAMHRIYDIWRYHLKPSYSHCITVPHMTHKASFNYFQKELEDFKTSLEKYAGRVATEDNLLKAIQLHNRSRKLIKQLYELRKSQPPLISGVETTWVLVAGMTIPVQEFNDLLESIIDEVRRRKPAYDNKPRLLIVGSEIDHIALIQLAEESGAWVVMDDLCSGSRALFKEVNAGHGAIEGLAERYLGGVTCPCTFRSGKAAERFAYLGDYASEWNAQGVIIYTIRYCDTYQIDAPEIAEFFKKQKIAVLMLEDDYFKPPLAQWKTRIEAFLETVQ